MNLKINKNLSRDIFTIAFPAIAGLSSQMIVTIINTAMVGRLENAEIQLAAMGLGFLATWAITSLFSSLSTGTHVLAARRHGEGNPEGVGEVLQNSLFLGVLLGITSSLLGYFFSYDVIDFFSTDDALNQVGADYMRYQFIGLPFFLFIVAYRGFFFGIGHAKIFMISAILINLFNIVFNYLFIFGALGFPRLELPGAGLGASVSTILGCLFFLFVTLLSDYRKTYKYYSHIHISKQVISQIIRISIPVSLQNILILFGFLLFVAITGIIGTVAQAATNVVITALFISMMPCFGFGIAAQTLVGQSIGKGDLALAHQYGYETAKLGTIFTVIVGVVFVLIPEYVLVVITTNDQVISVARPILQVAGIAQVFYGSGIIFAHALQAGGATVYVMFVEILTHWIIFLPLTYFLGVSSDWGILGAWMALPVYILAYTSMNLLKFRRSDWMSIKL
ncbi:MAG TPA: MATE family efflux transporter [Bacteroidota bacterium]|nr:MATE family efflux transporter [Bacteroidota bacterium]